MAVADGCRAALRCYHKVMPRAWLAAGLLLLPPPVFAAQTPFDQTLERMYNFDFATADRTIDGYSGQHPQEPLPYAIRASAYLFTELDRLGILEGQFFADD